MLHFLSASALTYQLCENYKMSYNLNIYIIYYYYYSSIKVYLALGYDTHLTKLGFKYIHIFAALKQQDLMFCTTSFMQY